MKLKPFFLLFGILLSLALSGCVKARISVNVERDGSGAFGVAMGMSQQLMALASSQGADPTQRLSQELAKNNSAEAKNFTPRRWTEGGFEWFGGDVPFKNLDELNRFAGEGDMFEHFSLTHQPGLFKDRFVLEARLKPVGDEAEIPQDTPFDSSSMFEFQMAVHLPGDVVETNGIFDNNSTGIVWSLGGAQPQDIHAVSEVWNWFNIGIAAAIGAGMGLIIIVGGGLLVYLQLNKSKARRPKLKKLGAISVPVSPGPAKRKEHWSEPIRVRLTPHVPVVKPAPQPVSTSTGRKPLKRLSRRPRQVFE